MIARPFDKGGPVLLAAKIDDESGTAQTPRDPVLIRQRLMRGSAPGAQARSTASVAPVATKDARSALAHLPGQIAERSAFADELDAEQDADEPDRGDRKAGPKKERQ